MRFPQIERRRKRYVPRQCVADHGMHKDSPMSEFVSIGQAAAKVVDKLRTNIESTPVHSRADWLALRKRDVTASEIGALFGCHPYRSALQVFADKTGNGIDRGENSAMRAGRILEPAVVEAVREEKSDWVIEKANRYWRHVDARLGATPDYFVSGQPDLGVLECKTANPSVFERDWSAGVPLCWTLQCLVQMMLTGCQWGAVAVLVKSHELPVYIYDIPRHPAAEAKIVEKVREFWARVENDDPPAADFTKDGAAIGAMFPRERGEPIDLSASNRLPEILDRRAHLSSAIKSAENEKDAIDAEIKEALGAAPEGKLPGWRITWKTTHRKETVIPAKDIRVLRVTDLRSNEGML